MVVGQLGEEPEDFLCRFLTHEAWIWPVWRGWDRGGKMFYYLELV